MCAVTYRCGKAARRSTVNVRVRKKHNHTMEKTAGRDRGISRPGIKAELSENRPGEVAVGCEGAPG